MINDGVLILDIVTTIDFKSNFDSFGDKQIISCQTQHQTDKFWKN